MAFLALKALKDPAVIQVQRVPPARPELSVPKAHKVHQALLANLAFKATKAHKVHKDLKVCVVRLDSLVNRVPLANAVLLDLLVLLAQLAPPVHPARPVHLALLVYKALLVKMAKTASLAQREKLALRVKQVLRATQDDLAATARKVIEVGAALLVLLDPPALKASVACPAIPVLRVPSASPVSVVPWAQLVLLDLVVIKAIWVLRVFLAQLVKMVLVGPLVLLVLLVIPAHLVPLASRCHSVVATPRACSMKKLRLPNTWAMM